MISGNEKEKYRAAGEYAEALRESYRTVVGRTFAARESNARLTRDFFEKTMDEIHEQSRLNLHASRALMGHASKQSEVLGELAEGSAGVYEEFLRSMTGDERK